MVQSLRTAVPELPEELLELELLEIAPELPPELEVELPVPPELEPPPLLAPPELLLEEDASSSPESSDEQAPSGAVARIKEREANASGSFFMARDLRPSPSVPPGAFRSPASS